jgi:Predicted Zn-dependent protease (DUF2268)
MIRATQLLLVATCCLYCSAQAQATDSLSPRLSAVPLELYLADSSLRIVNLYKQEALAVRDLNRSSRSAVLDRLAREVYRPYASFWQGYLGDEAQFRQWAEASLFERDHPINTNLAGLLNLRLDSLFTASAAWLVKATGRRPRGVWYIVFGPGWTDMGGLSGGTMLADLTKIEPDREAIEWRLAHELTHMVHGASTGQRTDPDSGTVLQRTISEGLASYATYVYAAGRRTTAQSIGYTDAEWSWALAHEQELTTAARPYLGSRRHADLNRFASRSERLIDAGPPAVAYFLGFRIVQAYVAKHGAASWTDVIDLPVREVLSRSGYLF